MAKLIHTIQDTIKTFLRQSSPNRTTINSDIEKLCEEGGFLFHSVPGCGETKLIETPGKLALSLLAMSLDVSPVESWLP